MLRTAGNGGAVALKDWRRDCIAADLINARVTPEAQEKAMQRICSALVDSGLVQATGHGAYAPTEPHEADM